MANLTIRRLLYLDAAAPTPRCEGRCHETLARPGRQRTVTEGNCGANRELRAGRACASRRQFLVTGSLVTSTVLLKSVFGQRVIGEDGDRQVTLSRGARLRVSSLAELRVDQPVAFSYPKGVPFGDAMLVKLGQRAGGGVGPEQDIVAFNTWCTHMGGDLSVRTRRNTKWRDPVLNT